tara:strand:- start:521 stop:1147 length:627 start_codon:yes stop_codon:yes gene_type:complete
VLKTTSISFSYDNLNSFIFPEISLNNLEDLLILGKSGIGKTTFIQILAGLLIPEKGSISLNGVNYADLSPKKLDEFRGKNISLVFQKPYFIKSINLIENLHTTLKLSGNEVDNKKCEYLLEQIGLSDKCYSKTYELSEGEKQRASIAMAVCKNPDLILADEPTASLDDENCDIIIKLLKEQAKNSNSKLIIITHDQRLKSQFKNTITL